MINTSYKIVVKRNRFETKVQGNEKEREREREREREKWWCFVNNRSHKFTFPPFVVLSFDWIENRV
jgi:hypothetical protein